jgi:hypothetical protein
MLNYLQNYAKKFAMDILPSVAATIIGAYIVNHYIVTKPGADAPVAAVSAADPKTNAKPAETSADVSNMPVAGVKAKGISEKGMFEKTAAEKPAAAEKSQEKSADAKSADTPAETASIPAEPRRHAPVAREKTAVRVVLPSLVQPAVAPAAATPIASPSVEAAIVPEERRDANDLARAAIERQRSGNDNSSRPQQAARTPDAPRAPEVAAVPTIVTAPALRPLPPPIMVSTPAADTFDQAKPPYATNARIDDPRRPTPPADIPVSRPPLDLRAEAMPVAKERTSVAEDVLSAAKSVFHAVLPK